LIVGRRVPDLLKLKWRFDPSVARRFLKFGITVGFAGLAGMLLTHLDNFLIGTFVSVAVLGLYERAYRTAEWPWSLLFSVVNRSVFFTYSKLQDEPLLLQKTVTMVLWAITTITFPVALTVFVVAPDLLLFLYGDRWVSAAPFLRFLAVYSFLRPFWENGGAYFIATGRPRLTTTSSVIQVLVLVLCGTPLTMLFGAMGTCGAVGLCFIIGVTLLYRRMGREVSIEFGSLMRGPGLAAAVTIPCYLASVRLFPILGAAGFSGIAAKACFIALVFSAFLLAFQPSVTLERVQHVARLIAGRPPRKP
jgi:PST family polysaccharide transporter